VVKHLVIGVDFDGTIVKDRYPNIGKPKFLAFESLKRLSKSHTLILWTCRKDKELDEVIKYCEQHGIKFNYVNQNTFSRIREYGGDCRKLSCDLLIDDKAGLVFWPWVLIKAWYLSIKK